MVPQQRLVRRAPPLVIGTNTMPGFDGFCPLGPCIVSAKAIPDPSVLSLQTRLNGELMQDGRGKEMIFSIRQ